MEHQKIINFLDNKVTQPSEFRTKNLVKTNYDARRTCNTNSQIKFKTAMLKSSFVIIVMHTYMLKERNCCWRRARHSRNSSTWQ